MGESQKRPETIGDTEETGDVSSSPEEDRCRTTSEVGKGQGTEEITLRLTIDIPTRAQKWFTPVRLHWQRRMCYGKNRA
jgi:hypothetical protein